VPAVDLNDDRGLAGRVISGYEIIGRIGQGGMGTVYLALDNIKEDQLDAVKVLNRDLVMDRERMRREAITANRVDHPNVCKIYNYVETYDEEAGENLTLISMELVRGPTLGEIQAQSGGVLELSRAARVVREVANALQAVHAAGIIHRDIKPTNVIVTNDPDGSERVKLVDFGIAKKEAGGAGQDLTQAGYVAATVHYASPEQLKGRAEPRSDIYSLGVVFFELLTGRRPFEAANQAELYSLILDPEVPLPRLEDLRTDLHFPQHLQAVVDRAMARDPTRRFAEASAFAEAVGRLVPDLAETVVSPVADWDGPRATGVIPPTGRAAGLGSTPREVAGAAAPPSPGVSSTPTPTVPSQRIPPDRGGLGRGPGTSDKRWSLGDLPAAAKIGGGVGALAVAGLLFWALGGGGAVGRWFGPGDSGGAGPGAGEQISTPPMDTTGGGIEGDITGGGEALHRRRPADIRLDVDTLELLVGQQHSLSAQVLDASGNPLPDQAVAWRSDRDRVASVSPYGGLVTALSPGSATIVAEADTARSELRVQVRAAPEETVDSPAGPQPPRETCSDPMAVVAQHVEVGLEGMGLVVMEGRRRAAMACWDRSGELPDLDRAQLAWVIGELSYAIDSSRANTIDWSCSANTIDWLERAIQLGSSDTRRIPLYEGVRARCRRE
jgi:serine/threonine-protein kinase